jgi:hypothetical protein
MARQLIMRRDGNRLAPAEPWSEEQLMLLSPNKDVLVQVKQARSLPQMKFMWAMLKKIADNHPTLSTAEQIMFEIKRHGRLFKPVVSADGRLFYVMESIAFEAMDQAQFQEFFDKVLRPIVREHILPGVSNERLIAEVMETL